MHDIYELMFYDAVKFSHYDMPINECVPAYIMSIIMEKLVYAQYIKTTIRESSLSNLQ